MPEVPSGAIDRPSGSPEGPTSVLDFRAASSVMSADLLDLEAGALEEPTGVPARIFLRGGVVSFLVEERH